jgi:hypothetical protein
MGRALELRVIDRPKNVEETLLHETLRLTPDQRLERFEHWYGEMQEIRHAMIAARRARRFSPRSLLRRLTAAEVDFVVVGGIAAVAHGSVALTQDLDVTYGPEPENLARLGRALVALDARLRGVTDDVPFAPDGRTLRRTRVLTLDTPDGSLDLLAQPDGAPVYGRLRDRSDLAEIDGVDVRIASIGDLIAMKNAAGRPKDLIAVEELEAIKRLR